MGRGIGGLETVAGGKVIVLIVCGFVMGGGEGTGEGDRLPSRCLSGTYRQYR
jgi:hypothetical protein